MKLVTGSKNVSSWTMRAWIVMRYFAIPFEEVKVVLNRSDTAQCIARYSPSGRIPCLVLDDQVVWDSMSICEYLAEQFPDKTLWPQDTKARAHARSICAEMHAGFSDLRRVLHLDICAREAAAGQHALDIVEVRRDVQRIEQIWEACLMQYEGPFLFGGFSIADAYFIPVMLRFRTYGLAVASQAVADYMDRIERLGPVQEWIAEAAREQRR
ncbi:glutathione S-transferase family protein [uncultured Ralstonia sp.]|jgi:glutathione S-transferase|uniref:glutathione S-transferase family protein n=1 Tax=Ralstonia sp. TaxID=54061 RepID=UPI0025F001CD|nr:glutathione S-transferase family protein [uncultured Ralstonia sp.]